MPCYYSGFHHIKTPDGRALCQDDSDRQLTWDDESYCWKRAPVIWDATAVSTGAVLGPSRKEARFRGQFFEDCGVGTYT